MVCTGESPENATITIQCTGTVVQNIIYLVQNAKQPMNITVSAPVPVNQHCTITIVFNNSVGSSEPFIQTFSK